MREHWTFVDRKTKKRIERDVERHHRLEGAVLVSSPADNVNAWPVTKT